MPVVMVHDDVSRQAFARRVVTSLYIILLLLAYYFAPSIITPGALSDSSHPLIKASYESGKKKKRKEDAALPAGGGGPHTHYYAECKAALSCPPPCGIVRDPSLPPLRLGDVWNKPPGLRAIIEGKMDFTRSAVIAAWDEYLHDANLSLSQKPPRSFFSTSRDGDIETFAFPWKIEHVDTCDFHDDAAACDMHTWHLDVMGKSGDKVMKHGPYDLTMHAQTYEHLYDLNLALSRSRALLAPGGYIFASMPAWNIPHMVPSHQRGITPCGIYANYIAAGFDVERIGWFGNREFSMLLAQPGSTWPTYSSLADKKVPNPFDSLPPRKDDTANTVWVLGRAPVDGSRPKFVVDPATRPRLDFEKMKELNSLFQASTDYEHKTLWPSPVTMREIFSRYPSWLDADIANAVFAGAFYDEIFVPSVADEQKRGSILACGSLAVASAKAFVADGRWEEWVPPMPGAPHPDTVATNFSSAVVTDLFEATVDPLVALRDVLDLLAPGATLLIACRTADVTAAASRPTLGTCTEHGMQQLLYRVGLHNHVVNNGLWGRYAYTAAAMADSEHLSLRTLMAKSTYYYSPKGTMNPSLLASIKTAKSLEHIACDAQSNCRASEAPPQGAEAQSSNIVIDDLLFSLMRDYFDEAYNGWANINYVLVKT